MKKPQVNPHTLNNHIVNAVVPFGLEFNRCHVIFGDALTRTLAVVNYPPRVKVGWLSRIANMEGVTCSIHLTPTDHSELLNVISKRASTLEAKLYEKGDALVMERAHQQLKDARLLLRKIDTENEKVFLTTIVIQVTAKSKDELEYRTRRVESALAAAGMRGRTLNYQQEDGLLAVSPYQICPERIKQIADRNMPISTIAGSYPFNSSGLQDEVGFIFGKDYNGGIILIDTWKRGGDRTNSNWTILGAPGVGKSATVKHIFLNEYAQGVTVIIIDPEREYKELCENVSGQWVNCGGGEGGRINPLQVRNVPLDDEDTPSPERLFKDVNQGQSALALHFQTLRTFFKLYFKEITTVEMAILEEVLEELYARFGITWNTDISKIQNEDFPIMSDLYDLLLQKLESEVTEKQKERYEKLALMLKRCAVGADSILWNGHTTVTANADFIVLDTFNLQEADDEVKRTQYFNILTWAWQQLSEDRNKRVLLGVDEAYLLVDSQVPQALQFLRNVSKRVRKYEGGLAVITHSVVDFLDESVKRYGQALLDNPTFKFFMGSDGKNLEELSKLMDLTEAEQEMLAKKHRGHGLLIAGSKRIHAVVELAEFELKIFGKGGGR